MFEAIVITLAPIIGWAVNRLLGERRWARVREMAKVIAADPKQTDDPREAVAKALVMYQIDRLRKEAEKVAPLFHVNGSNPVPKLDIVYEEIKNDRNSK